MTPDQQEQWRRFKEGALRTSRRTVVREKIAVTYMDASTEQDPQVISEKTPRIWAEGTSKMIWARPSPNMYTASHPTADTLPAGLYRVEQSNDDLYLAQVKYENDDIVYMPDSASNEVMDEITTFWTLYPEFKKRGLIHKRGVLMSGPQGSGKTSTIAQLIKTNVEQYKGIAIHLDHPGLAAAALQMIRRIEPDRPVVCILEDLDALIKQHGESQYLALLDGEAQIDRVVFVATTNYPELLDKRITNRPSRFDLVISIPSPSDEGRAAYIRAKEPEITDTELRKWIVFTGGYSIAHLREFMILVKIFKKPVLEAKSRLDKMRETKLSSDKHDDGMRGPGMGFTGVAAAKWADTDAAG